jgi:polysaccharide deacetylase family protein (PEP-CTERM system associated)
MTYLFSIDLEDVRFLVKDGLKYEERVPVNTYAYINWLKKNNFKCTFFVVGNVAETYPSLIRDIIAEGYEVACHSNRHIPLDKQTPEEFKRDTAQNIEALMRAGAGAIKGYRAPVCSMTERTQHYYPILRELGFNYSSSVLPAKNPLYGWEGFGRMPKKVAEGVIEIPISVSRIGPLTVPFAGGVYFRVIPKFLIMEKIKNYDASKGPLTGYFHPYDIDTEQEHFMHPGINNNKLYNFLMYRNRDKVFARLDKIVGQGLAICTYSDYINRFLS